MFTVRWADEALDELASLWTDAPGAIRRAITVATNQIDQQLRADPMAAGESRPEGRRVFFALPLGITYRIEADKQTVSVLRVWLCRTHS